MASRTAPPSWSPYYSWQEGDRPEMLTIEFAASESVQVQDIEVHFAPEELRADIEGEGSRIAGKLHHEIEVSRCSWSITKGADRSFVRICLHKAVPIKWDVVIQGDCDGGTQMDAHSQFLLAKFYDRQHRKYHTKQHAAKSLRYLEQASQRGHAQAHFELSQRPGLSQATQKQHLLTAAKLHWGEAQFRAGCNYFEGCKGFSVSYREAASWLTRFVSREQEFYDTSCGVRSRYRREAFFFLGIIHLYAQPTSDFEGDPVKAFDYFSQAAAQKLPAAIHNLGVMYHYGHGVASQDPATAKAQFRAASAMDDRFLFEDDPQFVNIAGEPLKNISMAAVASRTPRRTRERPERTQSGTAGPAEDAPVAESKGGELWPWVLFGLLIGGVALFRVRGSLWASIANLLKF